MSKLKGPRAPARRPTQFPELNTVLDHLVSEAKALLADNFVGAYLQGSFAIGDADAVSDCDFAVVVCRDLTAEELPAFQAMHAAIHRLPIQPWRHRLEGAYWPAAILKHASDTPRDPLGEAPRPADWLDPGTGLGPRVYPLLYLDHGADHLVRSEHDNTLVVRWSLREKGVVLAGPEPRTLIDPVPPEALKAEVRATLRRVAVLNLEPMDAQGWQAFWVGLHCRMMHTLATGIVASKKASSAWAMRSLDPRWRGLVERALAIRDGPRETFMDAPDPADVAETRAFAAWCLAHDEAASRAREVLERRLAAQRHGPPGPGGPPRGLASAHGPARQGYRPPPTRPGGRGRRG